MSPRSIAVGRLTIHDRAKDLVKSGGEWISSIDLENAAISHPGIATCAVIAIAHPKWDERPILVAVAGEGAADAGRVARPYGPAFCQMAVAR